MSYRAVEKRLNVQLGVPTSFDRLLICQEHINKTLGWLQLPFANQRLSYGTSRCFDAFRQDPSSRYLPPNVTRKKYTFSLMTQHNANSFTLIKIATYFPSKTSLTFTMAPWPFTCIPTLPIEKMKPQIKNTELRVKSFLPGLCPRQADPHYTPSPPWS